jgi:hypothetical protein
LQKLNLFGCIGVTDAMVGMVGTAPLQSINLTGCNNLSNTGISRLARAAPHLKTFKFSGSRHADKRLTAPD